MSYELLVRDDATSTLNERAMGTDITSSVTLQAPKSRIVETIKAMLADPNSTQAEDDNVRVSRRRDELHLSVGIATVPLKWQYVFPLVLEG